MSPTYSAAPGDTMRKLRSRNSELAHSYAVRLMQHLVVPTFVIDPKRRVVIWNKASDGLLWGVTPPSTNSP